MDKQSKEFIGKMFKELYSDLDTLKEYFNELDHKEEIKSWEVMDYKRSNNDRNIHYIYKVKRLLDYEIFTIGDIFTYKNRRTTLVNDKPIKEDMIIHSFELDKDNPNILYVCYMPNIFKWKKRR
jgi:hypothetical protein